MAHLDCGCNAAFFFVYDEIQNYYESKINFLAENIQAKGKVRAELAEKFAHK